jgi:hypothetical protein
MNQTDEDGRLHIEDDDARGAHTTGHLRWILGIGLAGAVIAMSLIWIIPALYG